MTAQPLSQAEQRLVAAIAARHTALVADLKTFVNIPTGRAPHPAAVDGLNAARALIRARLEALGASCELIAGDPRPAWLDGPAVFRREASTPTTEPPPVLVCRKTAKTSNAILLSGHLDTVHDPAPNASFRELSVAPDGKTATGPGVVDMKGGLVVALHALEALAEVGIDLPFSFILNSDEETGSFHSDRVLRAEAARPEYAAAFALEPANGPTGLVTARGGSGQCMLQALGRAAHVGRDFVSGRSATELLARAIVEAHRLNDPAAGSIVNISTLWCDQPPNQVADHAAAWGNLRYSTEKGGESLAKGLASICQRLSDTDGRAMSLEISLIRPAKPARPETLALAETVRSTAALLGQTITFTTTAGVCDGNNLQAAGATRVASSSQRSDSRPLPLPVLDTLGVRGGGLHTPQEWIDLSSLVERAQLLALLIARMMQPQS